MASHAGHSADDFVPWPHPSPVLDALGSLLAHRTDPLRAGFEVTDAKVNARGFLHAGTVATMADVTIGHALAALSGVPYVTVNLTCDLLGRAELGDWVEIVVDPTKERGRLAAGRAELRTGTRLVATAHALFLPAG
jgi:acyl-coenzyme A thioesterase PaaI-like protein